MKITAFHNSSQGVPKIIPCSRNIATFRGDVLIVNCDSDITSRKGSLVSAVLKKGGENLINELAAINYCGLGNSVITQGYELGVRNIVFMPIHEQIQNTEINLITLHHALRCAFLLASLYSAKTVAIPLFKLQTQPTGPRSLLDVFLFKEEDRCNDEVLTVIKAVAKDFKNSSIQEILIYRNTKPLYVPNYVISRAKRPLPSQFCQ
jgi:hypothetical protein